MKFSILLIVCYFFQICASGQSAQKKIDSLLSHYYASNEPGAVISIQRDEKNIFKKGYGLADLVSHAPITPEDNFNIGSLTKQFTAFAVLTLADEGKFALSDSIGRYLKLPKKLSGLPISYLLSHRSGIPDHYRFTDTSHTKHATDSDVLAAMQTVDTIYFEPGSRFRYSNTAYCLLGMLIEKISGLDYASFVEKYIFKPLDMQHATVFRSGRPIHDRVTGYEKNAKGKFIRSDAGESIFFSTEADGGIYISMNSYIKWCTAIETGKFSKTLAMRQAWTGQTLIDTNKKLWYGYGWFINEPVDQPKLIYHTGFNGGFRTAVLIIPSLHYTISIFSNRPDIDLEDLISRINQILDIPDNSFIKSGPLESFIHTWPIFAPCKETRSFLTLFTKNSNARDMASN